MEKQLKDIQRTLEREDPKTKTWDTLAHLGTAILGMTSPLVILSPWLSKIAIPRILQSNHKWAMALTRNAKRRTLLKKYTDQQALLKTLFRTLGIGNLLAYIYTFQIGFNTKQPSKILGKSLHMLSTIGMLFSPLSLLLRANLSIGTGFWTAGGRNDIENYNHLDNRRELQTGQSYLSHDSYRFILDDLRHTLSLNPWKELRHKAGRKDTWAKTNSALNAIASQLSFISGFGAMAMGLPKLAALKPLVLEHAIPGIAFASALLAALPEIARAWESRQEQDGLLTLIGNPIYILGCTFRLSNKRLHLAGLSSLGGGVFTSLGTNWTSKKHDTLLRYLEALHQLAKQQPNLNAQDVLLYLKTNPGQRTELIQNLGQVRFDFLLKTLCQAYRQSGSVSLEQFLREILIAHNDIRNPKADLHTISNSQETN